MRHSRALLLWPPRTINLSLPLSPFSTIIGAHNAHRIHKTIHQVCESCQQTACLVFVGHLKCGLEEEWIYKGKGDSVLSLRVASTLTVCSCTDQRGFHWSYIKMRSYCYTVFLSALSMAFTCTYTPCVPTWLFILSGKLVVDISYTESIMFKACWHLNPLSHPLLDTTLYRKFELRHLTGCDRQTTCCYTSHCNK